MENYALFCSAAKSHVLFSVVLSIIEGTQKYETNLTRCTAKVQNPGAILQILVREKCISVGSLAEGVTGVLGLNTYFTQIQV